VAADRGTAESSASLDSSSVEAVPTDNEALDEFEVVVMADGVVALANVVVVACRAGEVGWLSGLDSSGSIALGSDVVILLDADADADGDADGASVKGNTLLASIESMASSSTGVDGSGDGVFVVGERTGVGDSLTNVLIVESGGNNSLILVVVVEVVVGLEVADALAAASAAAASASAFVAVAVVVVVVVVVLSVMVLCNGVPLVSSSSDS
jgi:hypothetical protein